jgi:hypothetical protein
MDLMKTAEALFRSTVMQQAEQMKEYFKEEALINWHNTNECFSRDEYIRANCEYPGCWSGSVERVELTGNTVILAGAVKSKDPEIALHVTSFYEFKDDKVIKLDEYYGEDGKAPQWRIDMNIGRSMNNN